MPSPPVSPVAGVARGPACVSPARPIAPPPDPLRALVRGPDPGVGGRQRGQEGIGLLGERSS